MKTYSLVDDGISQSLMSMYMTCPKSFEYATRGLSSPSSAAMELGTQGHRLIELSIKNERPSYRFDPTVVNREQEEQIKGIMDALIPAYFIHWKKFDKGWTILPERLFDVQFCGTRMRGKIDAIMLKKGAVYIKETKFKNRISEDQMDRRLSIDWQANFYALAYFIETGKRPAGFIYDVVRYPTMKGTPQELHDSVLSGIKKEPEHWFKRWKVELSPDEIDYFAGELSIKIGELRDKKLFYKNQCACNAGFSTCRYIDVCTNNDLSALVKKELFSELK